MKFILILYRWFIENFAWNVMKCLHSKCYCNTLRYCISKFEFRLLTAESNKHLILKMFEFSLVFFARTACIKKILGNVIKSLK